MNYHPPIPSIETARLILRPYTLADAAELRRKINDPLVAATTLNIPHPYEEGMAEDFIGKQPAKWSAGQGLALAVTLRDSGEIVGGMGLEFNATHASAELGYWIAAACWKRGYATEAAAAVLEFGLAQLKLERIHAHHFSNNPASGAVMRKIGMLYEGRMVSAIAKNGQRHDAIWYGITRMNWKNRVVR